MAEEARRRQIELAGTRPNIHRDESVLPDLVQIFEQGRPETGRAAEQAATLTGTNRQMMNQVSKNAPQKAQERFYCAFR